MNGVDAWVLVWVVMNPNSIVADSIDQYLVDSQNDCNMKILEIMTALEQQDASIDTSALYCVPPSLKPNKFDTRQQSIEIREK